MRMLALALAAAVLPLARTAEAQVVLPATTHWDIEWRNPEGHFYTADLLLQTTGNKVEGAFTWTLRASPRAEEQGKIGLTGVERFQGIYDVHSGTLIFDGLTLEDPNTILGLDQYRLLVSPGARRILGMTSHGGAWTGELKGERR